MKTYHVYQVDSFTTEKFKGNPAGVVSNADGLSESQMQSLARELNNSETAFILSPTAADHQVWVRFFTPYTEVPSCGHATVAAHYIRAREMALPSCTVVQKIGAGILPVQIIKEQDDYRIIMTQGKIEFSDPLPKDICAQIMAALGLTPADMETRCPVQIVSTGHSKVMIGINGREKLNVLSPDMTRLTVLSKLVHCNGYYVFTLDSPFAGILACGRMFAPAIGINEDPVTGNANGPLGAYLVKHRIVPVTGNLFSFQGFQGEAIGRPGIVEVSVTLEQGEPFIVTVGGRAVQIFHTTIEI
ncbi:MAG TPA: PhzF family isomerase [bacterium]|nr:PhzF family isomerase [bacterium]HPN45297.1 PhzF family isomerase [bacterium]